MMMNNIKFLFIAVFATLTLVQCNSDDDMDEKPSTEPTFTGTYVQKDIMGRPGITTVFGGSDMVKNNFNTSVVSDRASFQPGFENMLQAYHEAYGEGLAYETNILGLDSTTFTTVLAQYDALQVAPEGETIYYNPNTGLALTGRKLSDDVIDVSLTLMFGGNDGARFDGNNGTPQLTSDGVGAGSRTFNQGFPYLNAPNS